MAEEKEEKNEKQKPVKPKKAGGEIDFKKIMIIIAAVMVFQVIIIIVVFKFILAPVEPAGNAGGGKSHVEKNSGEDEFADESQGYFADDDKIKYTSIEFDPVITKDFEWAIVLQLGFRIEKKDGEEESEGHGGEAGFKLPDKLISETKSKINEFFGERTIGQIKQIPRDSIRIKLKNDLRPMFKANHFLLRSVTLEQFTPTKLN